jgi:protoheme ferro-lyase
MAMLKWLVTVFVAFVLGVAVVAFLTVHPTTMSVYLLLCCILAIGLVLVLSRAFKGRTRLVAIPLSLVALLAGYYVMTARFLAREDPRPIPEITRAKNEQGDGHTAVIYFTHGEPETYDPIGWINQFREFEEQGIPFVPLLAKPIFVYQLRQKYLQVGMSHHRQVHHKMLSSLEKEYRAEGDDSIRFYIAFLDDDPRPDAAVIRALNEGAREIIVSEVFVSVSNHTAEGEELIEEVAVEDFGVSLDFTGPLWDSAKLHSMFVKRANENIGATDKSKVGVLLVGHGQPDEWDLEWPTETEHELEFRNRILRLFEEDSYRPDNLSLAWMSFKEPKPAAKIEEFINNGVEKIVFFAAAISADSIHSQYDIPALVEEANVPEDVEVINLGAWNDDPVVIQAIKERIDALVDN